MCRSTYSPALRTLPGDNDAPVSRPGRRHQESGVALPGVLLLAAFLVGVTGWLVGHVRSDVLLAMEQRDEEAATQLSGAAVQAVAMAFGHVPDWSAVAAMPALPCAAPSGPVAPLDEGQERAWLQAATDAASRWAVETPQWQLVWVCHASGVLDRWPSGGTMPGVAVWVADEPEGDGTALQSANERLLLYAVALGRGGARGIASATIARQSPGAPVELAAWRGAPGS